MSKPKPDRIAVGHMAIGALEEWMGKAKPSNADHDLDDVIVTMVFPARCSVVRADGTAGDGFNLAKEEHEPVLPLTVMTCLLFMEEIGVDLSPASMPTWIAAERKRAAMDQQIDANVPDDVRKKLLKAKIDSKTPAAAREALIAIAASMPKVKPEKTPTTCKRNGEKEVVITFKRAPKPKPKPKPKKPAKAS